MLNDFNLLLSSPRGRERETCSEIWALFNELGDVAFKVDRTNVIGLVVAKTRLNPFEAVEKLRAILAERPEAFHYTLKVTPIERVVPTDLNAIKNAVGELSTKIGKDEKFRVTVEKRHSELPTIDIVEAAASVIDRKVDLEHPDKIVLVEVLGKLTGISVIKPSDILAIAKERMSF